MKAEFEIRVSNHQWPDQKSIIQDIREKVFIQEQGISIEDEWDSLDSDAFHFLAYRASQPIGYARLLTQGKLTRVAVLASHRRQGAGAALVQAAIVTARAMDLAELRLDAQLTAVNLYLRQGFKPEGSVFMEANIPHRHMVLPL